MRTIIAATISCAILLGAQQPLYAYVSEDDARKATEFSDEVYNSLPVYDLGVVAHACGYRDLSWLRRLQQGYLSDFGKMATKLWRGDADHARMATIEAQNELIAHTQYWLGNATKADCGRALRGLTGLDMLAGQPQAGGKYSRK
jgi:hypothetical protein